MESIQLIIQQAIQKEVKKHMKSSSFVICNSKISPECIKAGFAEDFKKDHKICKKCLIVKNHDMYLRRKEKTALENKKQEIEKEIAEAKNQIL
jgi:hypothetical protein